MGNRPIIVTLCGSTRFCGDEYRDAQGMTPWQRANYEETLAGRMVFSIGVDFKSDAALGLSEEVKANLDELHKSKIDASDEILVLNVNGYIGQSTRKEIDHAETHG